MRFRWLFAMLCATMCHALAPNPDYALRVGSDQRHFALSDGSPFFWSADTAWLLTLRLNISEVSEYLDDRASKGFNMILTVGFTQEGPTVANRNGDLPLVDGDLLRPNEPYWAYVDQVVELAWSKGLRLVFVPAWGQYVHLSSDQAGDDNITLTVNNSYAFGHWFSERYPDNPYVLVADTNPIYTNETLYKDSYQNGGVQPVFRFTDWSPVYDELARGLQDGSGKGNKALITIHPTNVWFPGTPIALASSFFNNRDWLTFDACQSGHTDYPPDIPMSWWNSRRAYEPISLMYKNSPSRPVIDNEPHYENRYDDGKPTTPIVWNASDVRTGTFQSVFSGAAGFTYGADMVMQFYIPELFTPDGTGPASPWYDEIHLPGSLQVGNTRKLVTSRKAYPYLIPDNSNILSDLSMTNEKHTVVLRSQDSSGILVYMPLGNPVKIDVTCLPKGYQTSWFDPVDGSFTPFTSNCSSDSASCIFVPPFNSTHADWVLALGD